MERRQLTMCCLFAVAFFGMLTAAVVAVAADYPTRPVRIVVGSSPGGSTDFQARVIAAKLTDVLGQQVIVDNRPGAAGNIASEIVAKAEPDGYTVMVANTGFSVNPSLYRLGFDTIRDFAPIMQLMESKMILVLHPSVAASSVKELVALAKARPGQLNYGSSGVGTTNHLAMELFMKMAGLSILHVPYKGGAPAMIDLVAGRLQLMIATGPTSVPHIQSGKIKGIAVTSGKRSGLLPSTPTIAEEGLPGYDVTDWQGLVVPSKTPRAIINRLYAAVERVLAMPDVKETLFKQGLDTAPSTPEQFGAYIESEMTKWAKVIKDAGIKAE